MAQNAGVGAVELESALTPAQAGETVALSGYDAAVSRPTVPGLARPRAMRAYPSSPHPVPQLFLMRKYGPASLSTPYPTMTTAWSTGVFVHDDEAVMTPEAYCWKHGWPATTAALTGPPLSSALMMSLSLAAWSVDPAARMMPSFSRFASHGGVADCDVGVENDVYGYVADDAMPLAAILYDHPAEGLPPPHPDDCVAQLVTCWGESGVVDLALLATA